MVKTQQNFCRLQFTQEVTETKLNANKTLQKHSW